MPSGKKLRTNLLYIELIFAVLVCASQAVLGFTAQGKNRRAAITKTSLSRTNIKEQNCDSDRYRQQETRTSEFVHACSLYTRCTKQTYIILVINYRYNSRNYIFFEVLQYIMSTNRGSSSRKRPQKYQNKTAFKNDLHDTSQKTKVINSLEVNGVCKRCKDIIEWKIKYKKYKPLSAPRKCVGCEQKAIKHAYHMLCGKCALEKQVCAKCCKSVEEQKIEEEQEQMNLDVQSLLKGLPERKRRTVLRYINKQQNSQHKLDKVYIENMIGEMEKVDLDDEFLSDEDCDGSSDDEESNF